MLKKNKVVETKIILDPTDALPFVKNVVVNVRTA